MTVYHSPMPPQRSLDNVLHKMLQDSDLSFRDFVEVSLYHPELGYYAGPRSPVGKAGDFVTSPLLSPVFSFALSLLISEFVRKETDALCSIVDIGCGDGSLIYSLYARAPAVVRQRARFFGVDRSLERVGGGEGVEFTTDLSSIPRHDAQLIIANELFDALPFARMVMRDEHLHELWVTERDGQLDWSEHEAEASYVDYFAERGIELKDGQFADISLDWEATYDDVCRFVSRGLIVTFDYGYPQDQLFSSRIRHFGTAAAYAGHQVSRDLLANPGEQDLTAHINFTDLRRAGERNGFQTLFFDRQAKFLLAAGATEHELFKPLDEVRVGSADEALALREAREEARRLVLPDGMGEEIRALVQGRGVVREGWSFQRKLF
ncbi:MAG TPA: SAM-dependent methyltransferase [Thermoanaerobaculia bacterium]|nr:SAM-dependent methyltransferase [Thermoanaerobaculia bacterium]